ncbi:MAG: GntR family transcriptional regulator [Chelatococcus sp.]|jgi:DNA-binding GntR family transcriptional regulator|uniref:GntR family transcriptional regulator n=1 Tax=unclassified Chelatococcus TaxID=2638111 RepID=UPI001BCB7F80|nr:MULTISPECIES: GntR family transcriptional regulator [unclassified Chelatococcus]CAH1654617.1 FCD domain protein [Hyphomicrobiales bacterium]MBS7740273.1 GntR family transcriptional regulator [Chelatococcus sp. HY11]MBX3540982.1 GntR family transcriptional regulator [Chelatococcus sp.]MBX3544897.1 GntR family transcriptional regulator [Chelatococcus sp.]MCO5078486.1 GntR family transcriptional regulator [Chelatococcus sp.]
MITAELFKVSSRVTVQDNVYEQLRNALMWGEFEPGQAVTIASLANQFGTSHMPVREALRRLAAENALEIAHNGSARVPALSRRHLDDLCQVRASLEALATELATSAMTDDYISHCLAIAKEHEALGREGKVRQMLRKNQEFHFAIYERSGSEILPQMIEVLWLRYGPYMRLLSNLVEQQIDAGVIHPYSIHHYEMMDAFKAKDAKKAGLLMVQDIEATQGLLQAMLPV